MNTGNVRLGVVKTKTGAGVNVRERPQGREKGTLRDNTQVQILDTEVIDGRIWYYVKHEELEGYVFENIQEIALPPQTKPPSSGKKLLTVVTDTGTWLNSEQGTWFKAYPEDAAKLGDDLKTFIESGTKLNILSDYTEESSHYRFTLADGQSLGKKNTWYVYKRHAEIR